MPEIVGHTPDGGVIYRREDGSEITVPPAVISGFGLTPEAFGAVDAPPRDAPIDPGFVEPVMEFEPDALPPAEPVEEFAPDVLPPAQRPGFETTEEQRAADIADAQRRGLPPPEFDERGFPIAGSDATPAAEPTAAAPFVQVSSKGPFVSDPERAVEEAARQAEADRAAGFVPQDPFARADKEAALSRAEERRLREAALRGDPQAIAELEARQLSEGEELIQRQRELAEKQAEADAAKAARDEAAVHAYAQKRTQLEQEKSAELAAARADIDETNAQLRRLAEVDPGNFWSSRSTGQKLAFFASAFLDGLFSPYHGGRNMTLELIERAIDRDIAAQKATFQQTRAAAQQQETAYARLREKYQDDELALAALKSAQYERSAAIFAAEVARLGPERASVEAQQMEQALNEQARQYGIQAAERAQQKALLDFNQRNAERAHQLDRARVGVAQGRLALGQAELGERKRQFNLGITAKLLENQAEPVASDPRAINVSGIGLETPDGSVYVARSEKNADNVASTLNGSAQVVSLLDQALALGDVERAFPWEQRRNLRKQIMKQIELSIILAGGRSISDQDVVTLRQAVGSGDPDQFFKLISNETGRKQLARARQFFAKKLVNDAIANGAADRNYSASTVRFNPPAPIKPLSPPKVRGAEGVKIMVKQLGSSDASEVITAMAFMADEARRGTNVGEQRFTPPDSRTLSRVAAHTGRAMDGETPISLDQYMAAAYAAVREVGNPEATLFADQFYQEWQDALAADREVEAGRAKFQKKFPITKGMLD